MDWVARLRGLASGEIIGEIPEIEYSLAADEMQRMRDAMALVYGYLWHVNAGMDAPPDCAPPSLTPEKAAYAARRVLRDLMTGEQRGTAINAVRQLLTVPLERRVRDFTETK